MTIQKITFSQAVNDALHQSMEANPHLICYGLGINDPKEIFGTTAGLLKKFGDKRVFDVPTAENTLTGVSIGAALGGVPSVVTHQRLDFFLLAMDQLVNSAAKWYFTYGKSIPITIRLILGRGWGQGPTHSQNLQAWFSHIPGLKVVMPATPNDAKGLLISAINDPNPVIYLEHRWLHNTIGDVDSEPIQVPIGCASVLKFGTRITVVAMSYLVIEALHAANYLSTKGVDVEVIDLRSIKPLDISTLMRSVQKTGHLIVLDTGYETNSVAGEIIAQLAINGFDFLRKAPVRMAMPDIPEPSSFGLTKGLFTRSGDIVRMVVKTLDLRQIDLSDIPSEPEPHDIPGDWFKGPF